MASTNAPHLQKRNTAGATTAMAHRPKFAHKFESGIKHKGLGKGSKLSKTAKTALDGGLAPSPRSYYKDIRDSTDYTAATAKFTVEMFTTRESHTHQVAMIRELEGAIAQTFALHVIAANDATKAIAETLSPGFFVENVFDFEASDQVIVCFEADLHYDRLTDLALHLQKLAGAITVSAVVLSGLLFASRDPETWCQWRHNGLLNRLFVAEVDEYARSLLERSTDSA